MAAMSDNPGSNSHNAEQEGYDYLRDGPCRYFGYANEVGEAFRVIAPAFVVRDGCMFMSCLPRLDVAQIAPGSYFVR